MQARVVGAQGKGTRAAAGDRRQCVGTVGCNQGFGHSRRARTGEAQLLVARGNGGPGGGGGLLEL